MLQSNSLILILISLIKEVYILSVKLINFTKINVLLKKCFSGLYYFSNFNFKSYINLTTKIIKKLNLNLIKHEQF